MTNQLFNEVEKRRDNVKALFDAEFEGAKTPSELLQAYARYTGRLEAILDTIEVRSIEGG